jgi:hypothetical protein
MNDDELKALWQQQPLREPIPAEQMMSAMQNKTTLLRQCLDARDLREVVTCAIVFVVFGFFYFTVYREPLSRVGVLIVLGSSIYIAWKLISTRRSTPPAPPGATIIESLQAELNAVRAQSRLLESVLWWYLLPLMSGITIATWGLRVDVFVKFGCTIIFIATCVFINKLNQLARTNQLLPLAAQLESMLHAVETGEPLEQPQVANLRPIVLPMDAADQVKPVDFKVAYWQLAIWAEIGFIGIWFIIMFSLTMDNQARMPMKPPPKMATQSVSPAETNRYSVVARKVVNLLNKGDYAAIHNLYDPGMSKAFPFKETSDFYSKLMTQYGRIENFDRSTPNDQKGWTLFQLHCQRGELTLSMSLDAEDRISGLMIRATPIFPTDIKPLIFRLFSWQHLIWFVPFFLAGLVYTWLIQKTTVQAVGISSLGIHLAKGQNLILWDEIKDVQPFRFLYITNLWLVNESGEKTIMHWTPLERHADLKAAVEEYAPTTHPIRQYLSLLNPSDKYKLL